MALCWNNQHEDASGCSDMDHSHGTTIMHATGLLPAWCSGVSCLSQTYKNTSLVYARQFYRSSALIS